MPRSASLPVKHVRLRGEEERVARHLLEGERGLFDHGIQRLDRGEPRAKLRINDRIHEERPAARPLVELRDRPLGPFRIRCEDVHEDVRIHQDHLRKPGSFASCP